jgi:probable rRNA maturation factor
MTKLATAFDPERGRSRPRVSAPRPPADEGVRVPSPRISVTLRNQQRTHTVDLRLLRAVARQLFRELPQVQSAELGVCLVAAPKMTRLNESFLHHAGSTDVITFDYSELGTRNSELESSLHGEIVICVDEAVAQARRFGTTWQTEVVRYLVHGVLHLIGHDDHRPAARRKMKRAENRLLRSLATTMDFHELARS